ncbi:MAG: ATP-binding cassette domain-containing protein, partial [Lamprobacter sp.]|uniref:ATP-binding cassette domain-containing protein n=1 Tax=Lamprobacter sp. TaxID=3100796 RepID=UPI002B26238B
MNDRQATMIGAGQQGGRPVERQTQDPQAEPPPASLIEARFQVAWPGFMLDVDERLPARGVTALFGHSGSGKTTLLRCIAGLEQAAVGRLSFKGERWQDAKTWVPTHRRPIGYVF